jgi:uncharacterized protein (TIGR02300 family)
MATVSETSKALRGTKRSCDACEVRFYDLARDPIICPACGAQHTPEVRLAIEPQRAGTYSTKTAWRSKSFKRPGPTLPVEADPEVIAPEAAVVDDADATEEVVDAGPEDDIVLEQEPDDGDVSGLVDHDVEEPKDR